MIALVELEEWRNDRQALYAAHEKAKKFEAENISLRRDNLALQVSLIIRLIEIGHLFFN